MTYQRWSRLAACLALTVFLVVQARAATAQELELAGRIGQFKGYEAINAFLIDRLLDPDDRSTRYFELSRFFGESFPQPAGLSSLLGSFGGFGTGNDFRNGAPNGVNMLLWHLGFVAFGQATGQVCDDGDAVIIPTGAGVPPFKLAPTPLAALQGVCAAGPDATAQAAALERLWMAVFGYDLPQREMSAFVGFYAQDAAYLSANGHAQVAMVLDGMLLNPLFLLAR